MRKTEGSDRQIRLLGIYGFFTYPFACVPFLFFFFREHGIGLDQYLWIIAFYYWAMVLMEIPTGLFADRFGRRSALIGGSTLLSAGFVTILLGRTFPVFCVGEILLGIGHSLLSGAPTAMLFDHLRTRGQETAFLRTESRVHALRLTGTGVSFLAGGVLAWLSGIGVTIVVTVLACATGGIVALFLREAPRGKTPTPPLLRAALSDLRHRALIWVLVYFVILFGLLRYAFHNYQPYIEETVFDRESPERNWLWLGLLFAALSLVAAPCSRLVPHLTERFRYRSIFPWLPGSLCLAFLLMAVLPGWLGILCFFVHQVPFGLHWALVQEFVNRRVRTVARATALSILSFTGRLSFAFWIPLVGSFQAEHGTPRTYFWIGLVGLGLTLLWCTRGLGGRLLRARQSTSQRD